MAVEFGVLGPLCVKVDGRVVPVPAGRVRVLLAALLLHADEVVPADRLVEWLWDDAPPNPRRARATLQMVVTRLRQALGEVNVVRTAGAGYVADVPPGSLDLHRYRDLVARGRYAEALAVWRGEPLPDVRSDLLHREEVAPLLEHRLDVLEKRVGADLAAGRAREVVEELRALTRRYPLRESFWAQLVTALHRADRQAEALAAYQEVRAHLARELGVEPGPALREAHRQVLGTGAVVPPRPGVPRGLPAAPRVFVGRQRALRELDAAAAGPAMVIAAISGPAGVGKTALAVHWAHRAAGRYPDGQLYANLRGFDPSGQPVSPSDVLGSFLEALDVPPGRIPAALEARASLYRSLLADRAVLVLLDNARDVDQVRPLLPGSPGCLALVTSRDRLIGLVVQEGARPVRLDLFSPEESAQLLEAAAGPGRTAAEPEAVDQLVARCAGLPLALAVVAARTATSPVASLRALVEELECCGPLDVLDTGDRLTAVRDVFSWSYQHLGDAAARVFRLLGLSPGPDISLPATASLAALPVGEARRALAELAQAHLVTEHAPGRYTAHDLLRAYAADRAAAELTGAEVRAARLRLLDHFLHTAEHVDRVLYPQREPVDLPPAADGVVPERVGSHAEALTWFRGELRTLIAVVGYAAEHGFDGHAWRIPLCMATFLHSGGHWPEWLEVCGAGLAAAGRLGDAHGSAHMHRGLGRANALLHNWAEAEQRLGAALELFREVGDRAGEAYVLVNLAGSLELRSRPAEALPLDLRALELFRELGHVPGQARAFTAIGYLHHELGNLDEAVRYAEAAIELYESITDLPGQAAALENLGLAHRELGRLEEAVVSQRRALELFAKSGDRYYEAGAWSGLAETHRRLGDPGAAREALRNALAAFEELRHPHAEEVRARLEALG
ncbi:AfsR/SARP family transcriptional regulator [Saccharothrix syringae]|uniref:AfsR/SARP family transcriptional regulator n=1 Tax=Saccharothrix syringae TaxID=103733 RepID=A0A5Q0HB85_SACSY|nr:AfsR/SARP family transcriptional regulator [Saccharothrix syringae]QFZ23439.1 AfsR/SARP family transcriptional regulator [Saccharothrix syringae]